MFQTRRSQAQVPNNANDRIKQLSTKRSNEKHFEETKIFDELPELKYKGPGPSVESEISPYPMSPLINKNIYE